MNTSLSTNGGEPISLANYALTLGLLGQDEEANKRFAAAHWWADSSDEKALIHFNQAIFLIEKGSFDAATASLLKSFSLSRSQIAKYCGISVQIKKALVANSALREVVESKGRIKKL